MKGVVTIELPEDLEAALRVAGYGPQRLSREAASSLAASLFARGVLSLGKAARMAEMSLWDFIPYLGAQGIAVAEYDEEEARKEVEAAQWLTSKRQ